MAHLTVLQRYAINLFHNEGNGINEIARHINRSPSVVSREINRNSSPKTSRYNYMPAQRRADLRKQTKPHYIRFTPEIKAFVEEKIREDYSPEQIVGYAKLHSIECVSGPTIYKYIYEDKEKKGWHRDKLFNHLRCHGKKYKRTGAPKSGQGVIKDRVLIDERPKIVDQKQRFGDFEADTMWIANGASIVTVNDRATSLSFIRLVPSRKADVVTKAIVDILTPLKGYVNTITIDNGKEFSNHKIIAEKLNTKVYFAHPYHSWERGANENTNRLYRQYFKNKTKYEELDNQYILFIQNKLNLRPRKRLGFLSPYKYLFCNFEIETVAFTT
jgi:transposase, IS30 family